VRSVLSCAVVLSLFCAPVLAGQGVNGPPGPRILLPLEREIALARSAAPASVSATARIWVLDGRGFRVADSGSTGAACYVARAWPLSLEPHCFDEEGARTIMRMGMRRTELLHAGVPAEQVEREIADGIAGGTYRLPQRPVMSWMLSADQVLYRNDGRRIGPWRPHVMIYYPYLTSAMLGLGAGQDLDAGVVSNEGEPEATLVIVVPNAVKADGSRTGARTP